MEGNIKLAPLEGTGFSCWWLEEDDGSGNIPEVITPELEGFGNFETQTECRRRIDSAIAVRAEAEAKDEPTTTVTETTASETTASETSAAGATSWVYSLSAHLSLDVEPFVWTGSFYIIDGELEGLATLNGGGDDTCGIEDGTQYRVAFSLFGTYDITGTAGDSTMFVILSPTLGEVDVIAGDTSQLCVELSLDWAWGLVEFPLGNADMTGLPIEVPISGGSTTLDFGEGIVIEVTVSAN